MGNGEGAKEANTLNYRLSMKSGVDRTNELLIEIRNLLQKISAQNPEGKSARKTREIIEGYLK